MKKNNPELAKFENQETKNKENIFYHNIYNHEFKKGEIIDFFAEKSVGTNTFTKKFQNYIENSNIDKDEKIQQIINNRDNSFFLAPESSSEETGQENVGIDINKLMRFGFNIYEANNNAADEIVRGISLDTNIPKYINSWKKITSINDKLQYKVKVYEDYDGLQVFELVYIPYCPEYIIQAPGKEIIDKMIEKNEDKIKNIINNYKIIFPYSEFYNYENEDFQLTESDEAGNIDYTLDYFDKKDKNYYKFIINALFNTAISEKNINYS